jgi:tRNA (adenine57-N1/adenine58-N1)-methyltransferase
MAPDPAVAGHPTDEPRPAPPERAASTAPAASTARSSTDAAFTAGERVMLVDAKDRRYLIRLTAGASFHTHAGIVAHDDLIGQPEGTAVKGSTGRSFLVLRPTLADIVLKMPRGAQVIYPKDLAAILLAADIGPGHHVVESGVGSGALSMALLRAGARVVGYEVREDFAARARANVADLLGADTPYQVKVRDVTHGIDERRVDRILLDLPEPWRVLSPALQALRPGGILLAYLPTINQTAQLRRALDEGPWGLAESVDPETDLARPGHIGSTGPPDGRTHRLPHVGPAAGGGSGPEVKAFSSAR